MARPAPRSVGLSRWRRCGAEDFFFEASAGKAKAGKTSFETLGGNVQLLTDAERQFVQQQFPDRPLLEELVGVGIDIPQQQPYPRMPERVEDEAPAADAATSEGVAADEPAEDAARDFIGLAFERGRLDHRHRSGLAAGGQRHLGEARSQQAGSSGRGRRAIG